MMMGLKELKNLLCADPYFPSLHHHTNGWLGNTTIYHHRAFIRIPTTNKSQDGSQKAG
jgi:hypothetical protein